jgi:hypothetical protein
LQKYESVERNLNELKQIKGRYFSTEEQEEIEICERKVDEIHTLFRKIQQYARVPDFDRIENIRIQTKHLIKELRKDLDCLGNTPDVERIWDNIRQRQAEIEKAVRTLYSIRKPEEDEQKRLKREFELNAGQLISLLDGVSNYFLNIKETLSETTDFDELVSEIFISRIQTQVRRETIYEIIYIYYSRNIPEYMKQLYILLCQKVTLCLFQSKSLIEYVTEYNKKTKIYHFEQIHSELQSFTEQLRAIYFNEMEILMFLAETYIESDLDKEFIALFTQDEIDSYIHELWEHFQETSSIIETTQRVSIYTDIHDKLKISRSGHVEIGEEVFGDDDHLL